MELLLPFTESTPQTPTALLVFRGSVTRLQQDREHLLLLGETRKLQTNLLPAHYVCARHSLSSSLALGPAGFPKVTTICSYRGSFGSLGNFPFSLPLWNSDVSLSTTLLHIPTCAAKSQLSVSFPPNSSPGNFPKWAFSGACRHCLSLTPQNHTVRPNIRWPPAQRKATVLLLLRSHVLLPERPAKYRKGWRMTHKRYHLHQNLGNDVIFGLHWDGSPNRNLSQWCLYCFQKSALCQWINLIVHLANTRHEGYSIYS